MNKTSYTKYQIVILLGVIAMATLIWITTLLPVNAQTEITDTRRIFECDMTREICTTLYENELGEIRRQTTDTSGRILTDESASDSETRRYIERRTLKIRQEIIDSWVEARTIELTVCENALTNSEALLCVRQMARNQRVLINKLHKMFEAEDIP